MFFCFEETVGRTSLLNNADADLLSPKQHRHHFDSRFPCREIPTVRWSKKGRAGSELHRGRTPIHLDLVFVATFQGDFETGKIYHVTEQRRLRSATAHINALYWMTAQRRFRPPCSLCLLYTS